MIHRIMFAVLFSIVTSIGVGYEVPPSVAANSHSGARVHPPESQDPAPHVSASALVPTGDAYVQIRIDWHLASLAESNGEWQAAYKYYQQMIEDAKLLPLSIREWYRAMSGYGMARCAARVGDVEHARSSARYAFEHQFANGRLMQIDSQLTATVGAVWLDSMTRYWGNVSLLNRESWRPQEPIVIRPTTPHPAPHPMIIALHGGNDSYENFATYWSNIAELTGATVVVPPGSIRTSETENCWEYEMARFAPDVIAVRERYVKSENLDSDQVYLCGYSQGAQASMLLALHYPQLFKGAISFCGFVATTVPDSALAVAAQYGVKIFDFSGSKDEPIFLQQLEQTATACRARGIRFEIHHEPGALHEIPLDFTAQFSHGWAWMTGTPEPLDLNGK